MLTLMNKSSILSGFFISVFILQITCVTANAQVMGEVIRSENMPEYPVGTQIDQDTEIKTGENQKIAVKTKEGDVLVAGKNAKIKLVKPGFFSHLFGKIFYFISPRKLNSVSVTTATATIGIRGTKFIIDSDENDSSKENVLLSEGKLSLDSNDDEFFQLYEQREMDEYEKFKQQQRAEFDEFKQQLEEEFVAYKASINLDAGFALKFDGKKATRAALDPEMNLQFEEFEQFISENNLQ